MRQQRCFVESPLSLSSSMPQLDPTIAPCSLWTRLEGVRQSRSGLDSFHSLVGGDGQGAGLLEQLLGQVYSPAMAEVGKDQDLRPTNV